MRQPSRQHQRQGRESSSLGRISSGQSAQFDANNSSRQIGRLSSLTNLFRRGRKHSTRSSAESSGNGVATVDDYTAQWVESYSHTPRPSSVIINRQQEAASPLSRTASSPDPTALVHRNSTPTSDHHGSPTALRGVPIPYRSPPPLTLPGQRRVDSPLSSAYGLGGTRSSLDLSTSRLPTDGHTRSQTAAGHSSPVVRRSPRDQRPRPASAYLPQDYRAAMDPHGILHQLSFASTPIATPTSNIQVKSAHSTPRQPLRVVSPTNMSASCSDIPNNQGRKVDNLEHARLRLQDSGRATTQPPNQSATSSQGRLLSQPPAEVKAEQTQTSRHHRVDHEQLEPAGIKEVPSGRRQRGVSASAMEHQGSTGPQGGKVTGSGPKSEQQGLTGPAQQGLTGSEQQGLSGAVAGTVSGGGQKGSNTHPKARGITRRSRAVATPSPVDHVTSSRTSASPTTPINHADSPTPRASVLPTATPHQSHPGTPSAVGHVTTMEPRVASNASSSANIALSGSSALSQAMPEASSSNPNIASSNVRSSTNSLSESSASNSISSSRVAARLRAETRRQSLLSGSHSSSDENISTRGHTHHRHKRRKSQGVGNAVGDRKPEGQDSRESGSRVCSVARESSLQRDVVSERHGDEVPNGIVSRSRSPTEQAMSSHESSSRDISQENPGESHLPLSVMILSHLHGSATNRPVHTKCH